MVDQRAAEGHRIAEKLYQKIVPAILLLIFFGALMDRSFDGILTIVIVGIVFGLITYGVGFLIGYVGADASPRLHNTEMKPADPYEVAGKELLNRKMDVGIWARAVADGGTDNEIRARYIKWRVASFEAEMIPIGPAAENDTLGFRLGRQIAKWLQE